MQSEQNDVLQPPVSDVVASRPASISPNNLIEGLPTTQHGVQSLQNNVATNGNPAAMMHAHAGQAQQLPARLANWQAMQSHIQNTQIGHDNPSMPFNGTLKPSPAPTPASATTSTPAAVQMPPPAARNLHSTIIIGKNDNRHSVPIPPLQPGVSVTQPSTLDEYLRTAGPTTIRAAEGQTTGYAAPRTQSSLMSALQQQQQLLHRQQQQELQQQMQFARGAFAAQEKQHQMQQQQLQPSQQQLRQQFAQRQTSPIPAVDATAPRPPFFVSSLPTRSSRPPPPPSIPFERFPTLCPPQAYGRMLRRPELSQQQQQQQMQQMQNPQRFQIPVITATAAVPVSAAPTPSGPPQSAAAAQHTLATAGNNGNLLFSQFGARGLTPASQGLAPPLNFHPQFLSEGMMPVYLRNGVTPAHQMGLALQAQQAQQAQQQVMIDLQELSLPMEIDQLHASAPAATATAPAPEEEAKDEQLEATEKEKRRREQNTVNKRKQRQREKDEMEAAMHATEQALEKTQKELTKLRITNTDLFKNITVNDRVMSVRNAMLEVLYPGFAQRKMERNLKLREGTPTPTEKDGEVIATQSNGSLPNTLLATSAAAAVKDTIKEDQGNLMPPPLPRPQQQQPSYPHQQMNTFEIAESLAHTEVDACISYTRQLLSDVKLTVEEAFDDGLTPEIIKSIEDSVNKGRSVYKRVIEEGGDIYYTHVFRLSGNASKAAANSKEAAALILRQGVSTEQLLLLGKAFDEFQAQDVQARNGLIRAQLKAKTLIEMLNTNIDRINSARSVCHVHQAGCNVEVAASVYDWERFSAMRQNLIVELEEAFFNIMGPFNYAIVLYKSDPYFPNWGRVIEEVVRLAEQRNLLPSIYGNTT